MNRRDFVALSLPLLFGLWSTGCGQKSDPQA
jgi:hypothetical protein